MSQLFSEFTLRRITFRNRIFVSPMCQYSSVDGLPNEWHLVHLGSRAVGGAALVMVEATGVNPEGRITADDMGIWSDKHVEAFKPITRFIREQGAVPAIQLAHAGRKASSRSPFIGSKSLQPDEAGGWKTDAPSAIAFDAGHQVPSEMSKNKIQSVVQDFVKAAERSLAAGFEVIELHGAHGYLMHEFLSPLSNKRTDEYGGSLENRMRFTVEIAREVRKVWPADLPLFVRISASDWTEGGWTIKESVALSKQLKAVGVDLIDCSSGGNVPRANIPLTPGYQVPFAKAVRQDAAIPTGAVGLITESQQAEEIIASDQADVVFLARELLRDPYFPLRAAHELGADIAWPKQYDRAKPR